MFLIKHSLPFIDDKYETPTFLLRKAITYAPVFFITNNVDYKLQISIKLDELITLLYTILSPMEEVEIKVKEEIEKELLFLSSNYPLKYVNYAKSCSTVNRIIFINEPLEFVDAQLSILYNELLTGQRLTLVAETYVLNLNKPLNVHIDSANEKIDFINLYSSANFTRLETLTNYREQDYITVIKNTIIDVNAFAEQYYDN